MKHIHLINLLFRRKQKFINDISDKSKLVLKKMNLKDTNFFSLFFLVFSLLVLGNLSSLSAQTNPAAHNLSANFSFTTQTATSTTYPTSLQGWSTEANNITTNSTAAPTGNQALVASGNATTSGLSNLGANGFGFLATTAATFNRTGSLCLALNTTGRSSILVNYLVDDQTAGTTRSMMLSLQYRIGTTGVFTTLGTGTYTSSGAADAASSSFTNIALPAACENQAVVQIRWLYYEAPAQAAATRDAIRLDDITVTSCATATANAGSALAAICQGASSAALGGSVGGAATGGTWSCSAGGTFNPNANNLNATWTPPAGYSGSATLTLTSTGGSCGTATASKNITVNPLPVAPGTILGTSGVCVSQTGVAFSIPSIANATTYTWAYSGTGFTGSGSTAAITAGFSASATSGNLTVRGVNTCGNGPLSSTFPITVTPLPSAAGAISSVTSVCQGQSGVAISVASIANATSYTWAYSGVGFTPTASTLSTTGNFANNATSGNLTVSGTNVCGNGTVSANRAITINQLPATPGTITGPSTVCRGQNGFAFSVPAIANALSYSWSYSGTGCTFSGSTAAVTANFTNVATSGNITVRGVNACGNGVFSANFPISVVNPPTVSIDADYCDNNGFVILTASPGFSTFLWNTAATTSFINADIAGQYSLTATNSNGCYASASIGVALELVTNGKFDAGNTGFTTVYNYVTDIAGPQNEMYPEGTYAVVPNPNTVHNLFYGSNHTPGGGNFMIVNGSPAVSATVWSQNSITVQPNTTYYFSAWGVSVNNGNPAVLRFSINGNQVGSIAFLPSGFTNNAGPYNWVRFYGSWNSGFSSTANLSIVNLNTVLGGNDFGLDDISFGTLSPVALSVNPGPSGSGICQGSPLILESNPIGGASPYEYAWTGPNGFTSTDMNPLVTNSASGIHSGVYTLTLTDGFGCTTTDTYNVTPSALPSDLTPVAVNSSVCVNGSTSINLPGSQVGVSYQLRNNATNAAVGDPVAGTGGTINFPLGTLSTSTTYNVLATGNISTCSVQMSATVTITVATTPVLNITNQTVCAGNVNLTLPAVTAGSTGGGTLTYWTNAAATTTLSTPNAVSASGIYYIKSTVGSCEDIEPVTVSINAAPTATFSYPTTPYCSSEADPVALMTGASVAGVFSCTNPAVIFLNTATGLIDLSATTPGTYTIRNTVTTVGACADVNATATIVITQVPSTDFSYAIGTDLCQFVSAINPAPIFAPGAAAGTFSSTAGLNFVSTSTGVINISSSTPGNYAVWNTRPAVGGCLAESDTIFIDINPYVFTGSVLTSASDDQICIGESVNLYSSVSSYNGVLLRERFNGTINNWVRQNFSSGGTTANATWTLRPDNYSYNSINFSSNNNTQFYMSNSEAQAGTTTTTNLRSPVLNTTGYSTLSLDFFHYFETIGNGTASVQVSLNNSTWTTVTSFTTTQGTPTGFVNSVVNLNAYIGQPVFYIRFRYTTTAADRYWAIDNVSLTGVCNKYNYSWISAPAGYTSTASDPVNVSPIVNTFYVVNATNGFGCTTPSSPLPITVNAIPDLSSTLTPPAVCGNEAFNYTPTSSLSGATFTWTRPAVSGISNSAITTAQFSDPNEALDNTTGAPINVAYNYVVTNNGCDQNYVVTVPVKPAPIISLGTDQTVCNGSAAQLSTTITNGLSVSTYTWSPAVGISNVSIPNPQATVATSSQAYSVTVNTTNGCSNTSAPITISNFGFGGTAGLWTGNVNSDWNNCLNWSNGQVPTAATSVIFNNTANNICEITGIESCLSLSLTSNSSVSPYLSIESGGGLNVTGDVVITKSAGTGIVTLEVEDNAQFSCNNLALTGTSAGVGNALFKKENAATNIFVNGNLSINPGGRIDFNDGNNSTLDGRIQIKGNFVNSSLETDVDDGNASIVFNGTTLQNINCPSGQSFYNVEIDNNNGIALRLNNNIQILNDLKLVNGLIDLNNFNLTLGTIGLNGTVSGGGNNSYVIAWDGADNGSIIHRVNSLGSTYEFPIGDLNDYTPFQLTLNAGSLSNATLTAKINVSTHPAIVTSTNYLGRYWSIEPTGISNPNYNVVYNYAASDIFGSEGTLFPFKYNAGGWQSCIESASNAMIGSGGVNVSTKALSWNGITTFSEFTGIGNGTPLPIELLTFTADAAENEVVLNWSTASEINNHYFEIERSLDTKNAVKIGKVDGAGNSNTYLNYTLPDENPELGINYYRLKQVDFDGKFTFSEWIPVKFEGADKLQLSQFAVNSEATSVSFSVINIPIQAENATITVFDGAGRLVYDQTVSNVSKTWSGIITLGNLSKGNYIIKFSLGTHSIFRKFYY
jgi:hypothetical protein